MKTSMIQYWTAPKKSEDADGGLRYLKLVNMTKFLTLKFRLLSFTNFNVLLTVHLSITLVNDQLDAQLLYFIIRLLHSSTCFEQHRAHH